MSAHRGHAAATPHREQWRNQETIASGFVESAVNQMISKRMVKKQRMQWTKRGAHLLLQMRAKILNEDLDQIFRAWYPDFRRNNAERKATYRRGRDAGRPAPPAQIRTCAAGAYSLEGTVSPRSSPGDGGSVVLHQRAPDPAILRGTSYHARSLSCLRPPCGEYKGFNPPNVGQ